MLLFLDGQRHYTMADAAQKFTNIESNYATWSLTNEGRLGFGNTLRRESTSNQTGDPLAHLAIGPRYTRTGLWTPTHSGVCGFAFKVNDLSRLTLSSAQADLFCVMESTQFHFKVAVSNEGTIILRGHQHTMIGEEIFMAQSPSVIRDNTWAFFECKWVIDDAPNGSVIIKINGVTVLNFTGDTNDQDSFVGGIVFSKVWTSVRLLGMGSTYGQWLTAWISDIYLADLAGSGADVRDFLGDGIVNTLYPNGPGASTDWTPKDSIPNWDQVNDQPTHDRDGTYVTSVTPGNRDLYAFEDVLPSAVVKAAQVTVMVRKSEVGPAAVAASCSPSGTPFDGPAQGLATPEYTEYLVQPFDGNPAGGAWTAATINASQWGILKQA